MVVMPVQYMQPALLSSSHVTKVFDMKGTVFFDTAFPIFTIPTPAPASALSYTVTDFAGTTILHGQVATESEQTMLSLPRLPDDYYVLTVVEHTTAASTTHIIPFTIVAPFSPPAGAPFGVSVHFSRYDPLDTLPTMLTMGTTLIRDDATWAQIETTQGTYTFGHLDPYMQVLQQHNVEPLLILDYNNPLYDQGLTPYDEVGFTAFANYAQALVSHYGPQLKAVEVYNEYNSTFSSGPCARKASCYAQLLRSTYQAIKAVRPDVMVVAGATFGIDLDWFKELFAAGGLPVADALSVHPYSLFFIDPPEVRGIATNLQALQHLIQANNHGQTKPLWITEIGWTTALNLTDEADQAQYLVRSAMLSLSVGVEKFFWYDFLNDGTDSVLMEQNFGLLKRPGALGYYTPKPAYTAFAVLVRALAGRSFLRREPAPPGVYHMRFSDDLHVLWSMPLNQPRAFAATGAVTSVSMTGKKQTVHPVVGKITLNLSRSPLYLQGNISETLEACQ